MVASDLQRAAIVASDVPGGSARPTLAARPEHASDRESLVARQTVFRPVHGVGFMSIAVGTLVEAI